MLGPIWSGCLVVLNGSMSACVGCNEGCIYDYLVALRWCLSVDSVIGNYLYIAPSVSRVTWEDKELRRKKAHYKGKRGYCKREGI